MDCHLGGGCNRKGSEACDKNCPYHKDYVSRKEKENGNTNVD